MKKLGTAIYYECATSFKYIWIFYAVIFAVIASIAAVIFMGTGSMEHVGTNAMEINSMVYVGILGALGFKEDFKMLIQNGFTRKYIFLATLSLFAFISGILALMDTLIGNVLHMVSKNYSSLFAGIYGYEHSVFINWFWLFFAYMSICCLIYLLILTINKLGKTAAVAGGVILGMIIAVVLPVLFRFALPADAARQLLKTLLKAAGFMADGSINFVYPLLILFCLTGVFSFGAYCVIRKTELKL